MLTIFAIPKCFSGHIDTIQRNAIASWTQLKPRPQIILFGDEKGTADVAQELGLHHIPDVACNDHGTPLVSSAFAIAQQLAGGGLLAYVNSDIILTSNFTQAIEQLSLPQFMLSGQRLNVDISKPWDFQEQDWEQKLLTWANQCGELEGPQAMDYFVFPYGVYQQLPPFAVGRAGWDNWMLYHALCSGIPVIDATSAISAIHQNHNYNHHPQGKQGAYQGQEAQKNKQLMGGEDYTYFRLDLANWLMTPQGLREPQWEQQRLNRCLEMLPFVQPEFRGGAALLKDLLDERFYSELNNAQMTQLYANLGANLFPSCGEHWFRFSCQSDSEQDTLVMPVPTERRTIEKLTSQLQKREQEVAKLKANVQEKKQKVTELKTKLRRNNVQLQKLQNQRHRWRKWLRKLTIDRSRRLRFVWYKFKRAVKFSFSS